MVRFFLLVLCLFAVGLQVEAYDSKSIEANKNEMPQELKNIGIFEKLNSKIESGIQFVDQNGQARTIESFVSPERPLILTLVYFNCPSLCNLHLNGLMETLNKVDLVPGKDYELVAVSIDSKETPKLAKAKLNNYKNSFERFKNTDGIHFLTGGDEEVSRLAKAVGFKYRWDEEAEQWAHASAAILVTPEGIISRYLHGIVFDLKTTRLSIVEASEGKIGDLVDQITLFCFNYDPKEKKFAVVAFNVMRLGGGLVLFIMVLWLIPFWLRQRRKNKFTKRAIEGVQ